MQFSFVCVTFVCCLGLVWFVSFVFLRIVVFYEVVGMHTALRLLVADSTTTVAATLKFTQLHWSWAVCVCGCVRCWCVGLCLGLGHVWVAVYAFNAADVLCAKHNVAQCLILVRQDKRGKPVR